VEEAAEEVAAARGRDTEVRRSDRLSLWLVPRILEHWLKEIQQRTRTTSATTATHAIAPRPLRVRGSSAICSTSPRT
jgi:hypothetical protein